MTRVDPFIPVKKKPLAGLVNNVPRPSHTAPPQNPRPQQFNDIRQVAALPKPAIQPLHVPRQGNQYPHRVLSEIKQPQPRPHQKPTPQPRPATIPRPVKPQTPSLSIPSVPQKTSESLDLKRKGERRRRFRINRHTIELLATLAVIIGAGIGMQSLLFGQIAILAYAVFVFVRRIPSSTTLTLAAISLFSVIVLTALNTFHPLISTFAIYAFLLLVIGVASLVREIYGQAKEEANLA